MVSVPSTREEAKNIGSVCYFTGIPCKNGHVEKRYTNTGVCYACKRCHNNRDYTNHPERVLLSNNKWRQENQEKVNKTNKLWASKNRELSNSYKKNGSKIIENSILNHIEITCVKKEKILNGG